MRLRAGVAIDLGTVNTLICIAGRGLVVEEPSAIAVDRGTGRIAGVGRAADALAGKEAQDMDILHPMLGGVIADLDASAAMLQAFLRQAGLRRGLLRPRAVICVPGSANSVERRSLAAAVGDRCGRAAAYGWWSSRSRRRSARASISRPVRARSSWTSAAGTPRPRCWRAVTWCAPGACAIGGSVMDEAIMQAVKAELGLLIGRDAARSLKMTLGVAEALSGSVEAVGVDAARRTPRVEHVPGWLVAEALELSVAAIVNCVQEMLSDIPPNLAEDVVRGKIRLAGGGAMLPGLASRIEAAAGIPAVVVADPMRCAVRGAAEILEHGDERGRSGRQPPVVARPGQARRTLLAMRGKQAQGARAGASHAAGCGGTSAHGSAA